MFGLGIAICSRGRGKEGEKKVAGSQAEAVRWMASARSDPARAAFVARVPGGGDGV
jgi:hypothetical protein